MISTELISLICGSFTGFLFRYMAEKRLAEQENFKRLLDANARTTQNQDSAIKRVPIDEGKAVRQLIVLGRRRSRWAFVFLSRRQTRSC